MCLKYLSVPIEPNLFLHQSIKCAFKLLLFVSSGDINAHRIECHRQGSAIRK